MAISEIPVPDWVQEQYFRRVDEVQPVMKTEKDPETGRDEPTGEQVLRDGVPLWLISFGVKQPDKRVDYTHVKVAAAVEPDVLDEKPYFTDMVAQPWGTSRKGSDEARSGLWFSCSGVMKASDRPSSARRVGPTTADKPAPPEKVAA